MDVKAYAKINLGLDVLSRRADGYHEVCMVMQQLELCDEISIGRTGAETWGFEGSKAQGQALGRTEGDEKFEISENNLVYNRNDSVHLKLFGESPDVPSDERNLMYKAALLMKESCGISEDIYISCRKHIPSQAGLAGGSSDAAAVMLGINELFSLDIEREELMELAVKLGADVPFCVLGGTALSEGIGERLTALRPAPHFHVLLAKPSEGVSTKDIYTALDGSGLMEDKEGRHIRAERMNSLLSSIETGDGDRLSTSLFNLLSEVTRERLPYIDELIARMQELGAEAALMSGSGPTVYGLFKDRESCGRAKEALNSELEAGRLSDLIETEFLKSEERMLL